MYIKAGNVLGIIPVALVTLDTATAAGATTSLVVTTAALQTELATAADTDPILGVVADYDAGSPGTTGQRLILVDLLPASDGTFNVHVEW